MISHYIHSHQIDGLEDYEYFEFHDKESFNEWKKSVEKTTACRYIKGYTKSSSKTVIKSFICPRSGEFKTTSKGVRNVKIQGSKEDEWLLPS